MKSDLTCPIEVEGVKVERDEQDGSIKILCILDFLNLTDRMVDSVQMNIICYDVADNRLGGRLVRSAVFGGSPREHFTGAFLLDHVETTVRVEASVEKVWFKDGIVWRREERNVREYTPNLLPEGRELDRLRAVAGPDAMGYAREEDVLWLCVCGRANPIDADICLKCGREHKQVVHAYTYAVIDNTVGRRERDLEWHTRDTLRRSSEQKAEQMEAQLKKRRTRKIVLTVVIVLLAVAALALAALRWGVPFAAVKWGEIQMNAGKTASAKGIFQWVDSHWHDAYGSGELATQAESQIIEGLIAAGSDEALEEAADRAQQLGTPQGDALYEQAMLARAAAAQANGHTGEAEALYRMLPESTQAVRRLNQLIYSLAETAQENVDYPTAIARFAELGSYENAAARREECIELYGRQLMREGKYKQASDQFLLISGREGALDLARQCLYALAEEEQAAGHDVEAAQIYESLGIYQDAETRALTLRYQLGDAAEAAGDLETAAEHFGLAKGYEDAQARFEEAVYELGMRALDAGNPAEAVDWLERIDRTGSGTVRGAADALNRATYALAEQQERDGQREEAALTYASLGNYADADERAQEIEYALALGEMQNAPEAALARLESLGNYKDARAQALQCRYQIAMTALNAGQYETAIANFEALKDYQDSAARLLQARYQMAGARYDEGAFDEAATLYEACGTYLDAEERTLSTRYEAAAAYQAQGDVENAALLFAALGSYEDAPERARTAEDAWLGAIYTDATMNMELGDYDSVIAALDDVWQKKLPERYANLATLYQQACSVRSEELIAQNRLFEALPILERIPDDRTAASRLNAYVYQIIGRWTDSDGKQYVFRRDGTCLIDGEEGYFSGSGREIMVGSTPNPTQERYHVESMSGDNLTLRDSEGSGRLRLHYEGEPESEEPANDGQSGK